MAILSIIAEVAEQHIRNAMQRGEFDNLPGKGKPLPAEEIGRASCRERV